MSSVELIFGEILLLKDMKKKELLEREVMEGSKANILKSYEVISEKLKK